MDRAGFEPAASALRTKAYLSNEAQFKPISTAKSKKPNIYGNKVDWAKYEEWVNREYRPKSAYDRIRYAKTYAHCLFENDCTDLVTLSNDKREHIMNALSCLSKFLGIYEDWSHMIKNYGLKWRIRNDDLIIRRFTKTENPDELFAWIRTIKAECPDLIAFMDLMLTTGLRFEESIEAYNLIIQLSNEGKLNTYYNSEKELLEHYKFKLQFLRRTKKAFVSFVPKELIAKICSNNKVLKKQFIKSKVRRKTQRIRFSDIREIHGSLLAKTLGSAEIDFLHGRVSTSVFMRNYFNPAWIVDLKERTFKGTKDFVDQTKTT
ncbi:MAG: integrase [Candidatus Bathyarchaeia archaeon]